MGPHAIEPSLPASKLPEKGAIHIMYMRHRIHKRYSSEPSSQSQHANAPIGTPGYYDIRTSAVQCIRETRRIGREGGETLLRRGVPKECHAVGSPTFPDDISPNHAHVMLAPDEAPGEHAELLLCAA